MWARNDWAWNAVGHAHVGFDKQGALGLVGDVVVEWREFDVADGVDAGFS